MKHGRWLLLAALAAGCGDDNCDTDGPVDTAPDWAGTCPAISVDVPEIVWENTEIGVSFMDGLSITNTCAEGPDLEVEVEIPAGDQYGFGVSWSGLIAVPPGEAFNLGVTYTSPDYDSHDSVLWLWSNDPNAPGVTVTLSGYARSDQDGDGYDAVERGGDDCNDLDDDDHPRAEERWDGLDNDCDGLVDDLRVIDVAAAYLDGSAYQALAYRGNLGTGDLDGDGRVEVIMANTTSYGAGYVAEGADFRTWYHSASEVAEASWWGAASYNDFGSIGRTMGDNTGDGVDDLVIAGTDYYGSDEGNHALGLFPGGDTLAGEFNPDSATVTLSGSSADAAGMVISSADLDGDGIAEVVYGDQYEGYRSPGAVYIHSLGEASGDLALSDAVSTLTGAGQYDYLGSSLGGADLDGDGYDDLVVGAGGLDLPVSNGGAVYLFRGGALPESGDVEELFHGRITSFTEAGRLGRGARPVVGDFTGDSVPGLALSASIMDVVFVFHDASTLFAAVDTLDADVTIDAAGGPDFFGLGMDAGDVDGDGIDELAVGAPDSDSYEEAGSPDLGMVYLFDLDGTGPDTSWTEGHASSSFVAWETGELLGQGVMVHDLDANGRAELILDAPGMGYGGRVYFLPFD